MLFDEQFIHNVIQARNQAFQALNTVQPMINEMDRAMRQAQRDWDAMQPIAESASEQVALLFASRTWPQVPTPARRRLPRKAVDWIMMRFTHVR